MHNISMLNTNWPAYHIYLILSYPTPEPITTFTSTEPNQIDGTDKEQNA